MKNAIYYFYNIIVDNIHQTKKYYHFDYNNKHYILINYQDNPNVLQNIYNLHLHLLDIGINIHKIILNNENNIATIINGTPYILMQTDYFIGKINFDNILTFSNININYLNSQTTFKQNKKKLDQVSKLERNNIGSLWEIKNDYLEYQINQLGQKYNLLKNSFNYYIGLAETAISLINNVQEIIPKTVCHKRITSNYTIFDFYNPLNFIIDSKVRDIAEFLKFNFFNKININNDLNKFLTYNQLTNPEHIIFLARMIYPTYYFDLFEKIICGKESEQKIKKITNLTNEYENLLRKLYHHYRNTINIEPIEWLE